MACALCGGVTCLGHTSNRTMPVGFGMFGPEPGPPTGPNRAYPRVYEGTNDMYVATERLYLDKDGNVVKADDPARVSLLVAVGSKLSDEDARRYGLGESDEKAIAEPKANKAIGKAPANKKA